jgi:hypothetical protein
MRRLAAITCFAVAVLGLVAVAAWSQSSTCPTNQWLNAYGYPSNATCKQPAFSNLGGSLSVTQLAAISAMTFIANLTNSTAVPIAASLGSEFYSTNSNTTLHVRYIAINAVGNFGGL